MRNVLILADDLIWMSRLAAAVETAGASVRRANRAAQLEGIAADPPAAVLVDLNGRAYDGLAAVASAAAAGIPTVAVGQHEDVETRRRALAAGASQVYSYNRFHREGPRLIERLLGGASK